MTPDELSAIEQRANAATEGPWYEGRNSEGVLVFHDCDLQKQVCMVGSETEDCVFEDADFIAHSRTDVPALTAEVRSAWAENERLREILRECYAWVPQHDGTNPESRGAKCDYFTDMEELVVAALSGGGEGGG